MVFGMKDDRKVLPDSNAELKNIVLAKDKEIDRLHEEIRLLRQALFAPKSEKTCTDPSPQLPLFDIPENPSPEVEEEAPVEVPAHTRKKKGRRKIPENLPRVEVVHDIAAGEKVCACGCELSQIGEDVSEKLDIIPARIQVIRNIRPKYACKNCEGIESESGAVTIAPVPPQIIPKGMATAGLLAYILIAKFCDALPFYRQEKQFLRLGIDIPRQTMCNWAMKIAEACQTVLDLLMEDIRGGPLINIDETPVQVLNEPGRSSVSKSYMWVFRGGLIAKPIIIYQYQPTRSGDVAKLFVDDYQGVVQTDGYKGYDFLDTRIGITHVGCWVHARRKFMDAKKASSNKKTGAVDKALSMIRRLYALEKIARQKNMTPEEIYQLRQKQAKPIVIKFKKWLDKKQELTLPKGLLGKAINYCLGQWPRLENYLEDGHAGIDNNVVENAIRPFVIGRKNWLFSGTPEGAKASALLYSLIETSKANKLEPYSYLRYLFEKLPVTPADDIRKLLPTNLSQEDLNIPYVPSGV